MHGDGHGGIHWHDGLVDFNGLFAGRFDFVITNPPFGATVTKSQLVGATAESDVPDDPDYLKRQKAVFDGPWKASHDRVVNARGTPILNLFEIGKGQNSRQTETLFLARCIQLVKPGGWVAIILPNGNLNASSLTWLRRWAEGKAFLRAVVSLPMETFKFSKASVSASIVFLQRFEADEEQAWADQWFHAHESLDSAFLAKREKLLESRASEVVTARGDGELTRIVDSLRDMGVEREIRLSVKERKDVGEGAPTVKAERSRWQGRPSKADQKAVSDLKAEYEARLEDPTISEAHEDSLASLRAELAEIDLEHDEAVWAEVRQKFEYPVFVARPRSVGITATGETGPSVPNDLPKVLEDWQSFHSWLDSGANDKGKPCLD